MSELVNIKAQLKSLLNNGKVLDILLQDKTTKQNIIWATDAYTDIGEGFDKHSHIIPALITGRYEDLIQPRVMKALYVQGQRTKQNAEVFTPAWICNKMNNFADEQWFGHKVVFNREREQGWKPTTEPIDFPTGKTWQDYINDTRLEITCGEAPFLVSRYDAVTGEILPVFERIGMLDRKMRVVNENTNDFDDWMEWTINAYQSVYGYEWQGDNLLIARINLLSTFEDNMWLKWHKGPSITELKMIANIIAWNLWQMDGLQGTVPTYEAEKAKQVSLFEEVSAEEEEHICKVCRIYDWSANKSIEFNSLKYAQRVQGE
jgi:hypothetical protein